jgi:DNA-binding response OmpR family regulator
MPKILIIEDDPAIQEGLKELLLLEHYSIERAYNGITGLELAKRIKPDLILLDVNLPGKGGYDVCRELRSLHYQNPIIILSSKSEQVDKVLGLEFGADDYITKPFDSRELLARVRANLRKGNRIENISSGEEPWYEKKLCTILFSDMRGYSEMMNHDELAALEILREHNSILKRNITESGGKVIEISGDAFLASFEAASSAVEAACSIQEELSIRNISAKKGSKIIVRIGIHLGDVFVFSDNIKGDVLNIAARVQQEAIPGSVFITMNVHDVLRNNKNFFIESRGSYKLKNIDQELELFSVTRNKNP